MEPAWMRLSNLVKDTGGAVKDVRTEQHDGVTALRADFVAKPEAIENVREGIEARVRSGWGEESGSLNGIDLVTDQEARLTKLITFWTSVERAQEGVSKVHWVHTFVKPLLDR